MAKRHIRRYWILKTEPDVFSIDDLRSRGYERWDGVRNFQARNNLRAMKKGDGVFIYHSSVAEPAIVGEGIISEAACPDPLQFDPKSQYYDSRSTQEKPLWSAVMVTFASSYKQRVPLKLIKSHKVLSKMSVAQQGSRLSVLHVSSAHASLIRKISTKQTLGSPQFP